MTLTLIFDPLQDSPEVVFHITAYNSQVDKILDVRLLQPGTRIGQASECFVYWKDPVTSDTWGLNFTSPIDAKQFKDCCVSSRLRLRIGSIVPRCVCAVGQGLNVTCPLSLAVPRFQVFAEGEFLVFPQARAWESRDGGRGRGAGTGADGRISGRESGGEWACQLDGQPPAPPPLHPNLTLEGTGATVHVHDGGAVRTPPCHGPTLPR